VRRADNLTTFKCRLSRNLGASTSWNPKGLSRPVMGLLYLLPLPWKGEKKYGVGVWPEFFARRIGTDGGFL
jgi:hypothetical protein